MRAAILVAVAILMISGCRKSATDANPTNVDQTLASQNIAANDTTAIDAATGDDANMAADVKFTANDSLDGATNNAN